MGDRKGGGGRGEGGEEGGCGTRGEQGLELIGTMCSLTGSNDHAHDESIERGEKEGRRGKDRKKKKKEKIEKIRKMHDQENKRKDKVDRNGGRTTGFRMDQDHFFPFGMGID